jgi:hypothetical protein
MKRMVLCVLILLVLVSVVSAAPTPTQALPAGQILRISSEVGETYIQFSWKSEPSSVAVPPLNILVDDAQTPIIYNYTSSSYLMDELKDGTRHNIALYDATNWGNGTRLLLGKGTTTTLKPAYEIYFLIAITVGLMILTIVLGNDLVKLILLSIFNILICIFGMSLANGRGLLMYLFIGIGVVTTIILIVNALPKLQEELAWF